MLHSFSNLSLENNRASNMNFQLIICLMLVAMAMARKGSTPTNCRKSDCKGSFGTVQLESLGTTGQGGSECTKRNGEIRKKCKNRENKKNDGNFGGNLSQNSQVSSSPSVHTESSSDNRDSRTFNLGSLFGTIFGGRPTTSSVFGGRPTTSSVFGGRPTTSSVFGGRPTINRPISSFGSNHNHGSSFGNNHNHGSSFGNTHNHGSSFGNNHNHGSSFGNNHNHGSSLGGSLSSGFGPGLSIGFGPSHGSSFGNSFGSSFGSSSSGCRFWCRTPQHQAYCCENSHQTPGGLAGFPKPGQCPPVRPFCPPTGRSLRPPSQCSSDARCPGREKCCFDTCLQHHTCKPPQGGFFGR